MADNEKTNEQLQDERVAKIIDTFRDRILALRTLAETQLTHARENQRLAETGLLKQKDDAIALYTLDESERVVRGRAVNAFLDASRELESLRTLQHEKTLAETIFIYTFSVLDAYLGAFLREAFTIRPELLLALDAREPSDSDPTAKQPPSARMVPLRDVLQLPASEIVNSVVERVLDSLLRASYIEAFDKLASRFESGTLKGFKNWPVFVECSQRRHLVVHCGGVVSSQYLKVCTDEKAPTNEAKSGDTLEISEPYLHNSIMVVAETGLKVGQVLWRNLRQSSVAAADVHLGTNILFELLKREQWNLAQRLGEFGRDCTKRKHETPRSEALGQDHPH